VHEWEIAVLHRAHRAGDGSCARVTWTRTDAAKLDHVIDAYKDSLMPWWEQTPGFCSNSLMVDRREGRCASGYRSARRGQYRVIYSIHDDEVLVRVVRISHRADVYG
jgi:mRNA-degrading endonuclease RelE of RelBE toxin-antitoxin system